MGPSPVDRARPGSKHHLITEAHGIPLAVSLTGGNRNDVTQLIPLIDAAAARAAARMRSTPTAATTTTSTASRSGTRASPR
jgi:hypothetical protein